MERWFGVSASSRRSSQDLSVAPISGISRSRSRLDRTSWLSRSRVNSKGFPLSSVGRTLQRWLTIRAAHQEVRRDAVCRNSSSNRPRLIRSGKLEGWRPLSVRKRTSCCHAPSRGLPFTSWTSSGPSNTSNGRRRKAYARYLSAAIRLRRPMQAANGRSSPISRAVRTGGRQPRRTSTNSSELLPMPEDEAGLIGSGISVAIAAVLASPNFLFRIERPAEPRSANAQYDLASRLSYFLVEQFARRGADADG